MTSQGMRLSINKLQASQTADYYTDKRDKPYQSNERRQSEETIYCMSQTEQHSGKDESVKKN